MVKAHTPDVEPANTQHFNHKPLTDNRKPLTYQTCNPQHTPQVNERLSEEVMSRLEVAKLTLHRIHDMSADELGSLLHRPAAGREVKLLARMLPRLDCSVKVAPLVLQP